MAADARHDIVRHVHPHVAERHAWHRARHPSDHLLSVAYLVAGPRVLDFDLAQHAIRMPAVVQARDRLLSRIAPFRERDVRLVEPGLRRKHGLVELLAPRRHARLDARPLELLGLEQDVEIAVEHLDGPGNFAGEPFGDPEYD